MNSVLLLRDNVFHLIGDINCYYNCGTDTYYYFMKIYLLELNTKHYELFSNFINYFNIFLNNGVNIDKSVQRELGNNEIIDSIKFIQEEIKLIRNRFNNHFNNTRFGSNYVKNVSQENYQSEISV